MEITLDNNFRYPMIRAYQHGRIQINAQWFERSLIITLEQGFETWPPQHLAELQSQHLLPILALEPDLVLLGTGEQFIFPSPALLAPFYEKRIGVEIMDTAAACRTYNALAAEGRKVVAALLIH